MTQNVRIDGVALTGSDGVTPLLHAMMEGGRQVIFRLDTNEVIFTSSTDIEIPDLFARLDEEGNVLLDDEGKKIPLHTYAGVSLFTPVE